MFYGNTKKTTCQFIEDASKRHGDKYDYSKSEYKNASIKICIICPEHGEFWIRPNAHTGKQKQGCRKCRDGQFKDTKQTFIEKAKLAHGDRYDYSKVEYKSSRHKVCIICPKHGEFYQSTFHHVRGFGCPSCNESKGEKVIRDILQDIDFEYQKTFNTCKDISLLPYDFYLPEYNILIEYDGEQHFRPVAAFRGEEGFKDRQKKDAIKTKWASDNNIPLYRIRYDEDIQQRMSEILEECMIQQ